MFVTKLMHVISLLDMLTFASFQNSPVWRLHMIGFVSYVHPLDPYSFPTSPPRVTPILLRSALMSLNKKNSVCGEGTGTRSQHHA